MSGEDRSWMDNRRNPNRRGITPTFIAGLEHFVQFAKTHPQYMHNGMIRCPCKRCKNKKFHRDGFVKEHLMDQGFVDGYKIWVAHGERYSVETSVQNRPIDGHTPPPKKSKVLAFVPTISQSYKDRHSILRANAEIISEDDSLSSPGQGSSTAAGHEPIAPEGRVLLNRVVHEGKCVISISPSMQFIHNAHTSPSRWFGEIIRKHPFQEFFPTPKTLPKTVYELWLSEFQREYCCLGFSQQQIEKAFKEMVYSCYGRYVQEMHTKWKKTGQAAPNYSPEVWAKWEEHWRSQNFQNISDKANTNRNSNEGQGSVHTGGSISLSESWDCLVKCHGPDVDASEAFLATHSSVSANGTRKWSSCHYQEIYETYVRRAREEAIEEGIIEIESTGLPPFRAGLWKTITIQHGRQKGDRLPKFENHGPAFFDLPLSSRSSQSFSSSNIQNVDYDAQMRQNDEIIASLTETLNTQVDTRVNTLVKEMEERMHERLRQEKERMRQEKEQMRQEKEQMWQEMKQKMQQQMQQQMQEMMRSMLQQQQQQPASGNNSNTSIGPYLNSNGTLSRSGRRGGRGGNNTNSRKS